MPLAAETLTVSQLNRRIRTLLEIQVGEVWIEGEVSTLRPNRSGHVYFTLKDDRSQVPAVMFRSTAARARVKLREGMQVRIRGEVSVYEPHGRYQLIVATIEEQGEGELRRRFEELKRKLESEGLFEASRKRSLPEFPRVIGIVTSPTGAALQDMLNVLGRRAPWVRLILAPVPVQGKGSGDAIAGMLETLGRESGRSLPAFDLLIVGRGGGSIEDLWAFNEERLARAIAACPIPLISAVGHEIDFTIADFVADLRAPTPSAAAELAVPDAVEIRQRIDRLGMKMKREAQMRLESCVRVLSLRGAGSLERPTRHILRQAEQQLDNASWRLAKAPGVRVERAGARLRQAFAVLSLHEPTRLIESTRQRVAESARRLHEKTTARLALEGERLEATAALLDSLSPAAVLRRGFSMTMGPDGTPLRDPEAVSPGQPILTHLAGGKLHSSVTPPPSRDS